MNRVYIYFCLLCAIEFSGCSGRIKEQSAERPNILMICIDDMNDWVGFLDGHPQARTPNMDKLAAKGVNFTNAHCTAPGCSPSRNAVLFGIEPYNSGLYPFYNINNIDSGILDAYTPLPLLFRNNGYITCGLKKVFHNPDNAYLQDSIWDDYKSFPDGDIQLMKEKGYYPDPYNRRVASCPASNPAEDFMDRRSADYAAEFLRKPHEKPFFLAVGFIRPHSPFIAPEENYDRFTGPIQAPEIKADDLIDIPLAGRSNAQIYAEINIRKDTAWEKIRRGYLACISFTDDNVGVVLNALAESPYTDNTIVILWSDHGYHLGEKRTFTKFSLWEESTHSPFIIWDTRGRPANGQKCVEAVGLINIYKTLCDLAGLNAPEYVDGLSLAPWLEDPSIPKEKPAITTWGRGNYTLRTREWRYTRYFDGSEELYNIADDPNEWRNLAESPEWDSLKTSLAEKWLPKSEAAQIISGRELYNVADADDPKRYINKHLSDAERYKRLGLQPPLD